MPYFFKTFLRKLFSFIIIFSQISLVLSCSNQEAIHTKSSYVIDGDTFDATNGKRYRLVGIDTPEIPKSVNDSDNYNEWQITFGTLAKEYSDNFLSKKDIKVDEIKLDTYNRVVAKINVNNEDLSLSLLKKGYAIVRYISLEKGNPFYTSDYSYYKKLIDTQFNAYIERVGIWEYIDYIGDIFP